MASDLKSFLVKNTKVRNTKTIPVTLKSGDKREIDIQSLTGQEFKKIFSQNTKTYPAAEGTSAMAATSQDPFGLALDIVKTGITAPDLNSMELQDFYHVYTVDDLLYELFEIAEITRISTEIQDLSGSEAQPTTTGTEPEAIREAKNSSRA